MFTTRDPDKSPPAKPAREPIYIGLETGMTFFWFCFGAGLFLLLTAFAIWIIRQ